MKLQVNLNGGWRDVLPGFGRDDRDRVLNAAVVLADVMGSKAKWRYLDEFNHPVHWSPDTRAWKLLGAR